MKKFHYPNIVKSLFKKRSRYLHRYFKRRILQIKIEIIDLTRRMRNSCTPVAVKYFLWVEELLKMAQTKVGLAHFGGSFKRMHFSYNQIIYLQSEHRLRYFAGPSIKKTLFPFAQLPAKTNKSSQTKRKINITTRHYECRSHLIGIFNSRYGTTPHHISQPDLLARMLFQDVASLEYFILFTSEKKGTKPFHLVIYFTDLLCRKFLLIPTVFHTITSGPTMNSPSLSKEQSWQLRWQTDK